MKTKLRCGESACERHFIFKDPFRMSLMTSYYLACVPPMADLSHNLFSHPFPVIRIKDYAANRYTELSNFPAKRKWKTFGSG